MSGGMRHQDVPAHIETIAHAVIGCAIEVHKHLGPGLLESLYEHALVHEAQSRGLHIERQVEIRVPYKDTLLPPYRIDLMVERLIVVEIKAVEAVLDVHKAQLLSYLRMSGLSLGLLINFNDAVLKNGLRRVLNERSKQLSSTSRSSSLRVQPD
jgi:GxxExxY protein